MGYFNSYIQSGFLDHFVAPKIFRPPCIVSVVKCQGIIELFKCKNRVN